MSRRALASWRIWHSTALLALALSCLLAVACRGAEVATSEPETEPEATATAVTGSLPTPEPTNSGPGRVRASIETNCKLLENGAEVTMVYRVNAIGANRLSRVQMTMNGAYTLDTGTISQINYTEDRQWRVAAGTKIAIVLLAESPGNPTTIARSLVQCPKAPEPNRL